MTTQGGKNLNKQRDERKEVRLRRNPSIGNDSRN